MRQRIMRRPSLFHKTVLRTIRGISRRAIGFEDPARMRAVVPKPEDPGSVGAWKDAMGRKKKDDLKSGLSGYTGNNRK